MLFAKKKIIVLDITHIFFIDCGDIIDIVHVNSGNVYIIVVLSHGTSYKDLVLFVVIVHYFFNNFCTCLQD